MYWMDLAGGDPEFYRDLFGWEPAGAGVFTVDGQVVAGHGSPGPPGWNLHAVVDDVAGACAEAERHGGTVLTRSPATATVADPAGAAFVLREPGREAELSHKPGTFTWAELCSPDTEAARSFYRALFGWDTVDVPMSMPAGLVGYTVFMAGETEAAGLLPAEGAFGPAAPPYWLAYVEAEDAGAVAARVGELGGAVLVEPFEVPKIGWIALLAGRSGETFAVMQMPGGTSGSSAG